MKNISTNNIWKKPNATDNCCTVSLKKLIAITMSFISGFSWSCSRSMTYTRKTIATTFTWTMGQPRRLRWSSATLERTAHCSRLVWLLKDTCLSASRRIGRQHIVGSLRRIRLSHRQRVRVLQISQNNARTSYDELATLFEQHWTRNVANTAAR